MKTGTRTAAWLTAAALSVSLSVSVAAPAALAADTSGAASGVAARGEGQRIDARQAATLKKLKARLRKAVKAKKRAAIAVDTATTKLQALRDAGTAAIFTYQGASVALDEARAKHATAKAALDRTQSLVANEGALWADLNQRMTAAQAGYQPLRAAYDAAVARRTELQNAVQALRTQQTTAWANQNEAAVAASNVQADISQAQDAYSAAWAAEQRAWDYKEACRTDFERRKAQWDATRKNFGHWEGLRNGTWRPVPGLDDAEALLDRAQAEYNQKKDERANIENHLAQLNARLAEIQADIQRWADVAADLQRQIDAHAQPLADQSAAVTAASAAMDAYYAQHIDPLRKEADQLRTDLEAAKANLPALVAAEKPLADAVTQASAALAAATPAFQSAQAAIDAAELVMAKARDALAKAESTVKKLKKQIRKAKSRR
jgi:chromosome segregation ATPase